MHDAGNYVVNPEASTPKLAKRRGRWLAWEQRGGRVTAGHVPYSVYRQYLPQGTRYVTFLRDPVDRVVSRYYNHVHKERESSIRRSSAGRRC
jgi:hypothetical protein